MAKEQEYTPTLGGTLKFLNEGEGLQQVVVNPGGEFTLQFDSEELAGAFISAVGRAPTKFGLIENAAAVPIAGEKEKVGILKRYLKDVPRFIRALKEFGLEQPNTLIEMAKKYKSAQVGEAQFLPGFK